MAEPAAGIVQWIWTSLVLPLGWMWTQIRVHEKRLTDHEIKDAEIYMHRDEVHRAINDALGPIRLDTGEIKQDLKEIRRHLVGKA